jgi:hypothetical protein
MIMKKMLKQDFYLIHMIIIQFTIISVSELDHCGICYSSNNRELNINLISVYFLFIPVIF